MFTFDENKEVVSEASDKEFVGRLVVIAGRSDAKLGVRMTLDNSGQLEGGIEIMKNGTAGDNTLLNIGSLFEDALKALKGANFDAYNNKRVEFYMPSMVSDFINFKYYLEIIESQKDIRPRNRSRKICDKEVVMWKSVSALLEEFGNKVVVRDISKIKIDGYYRKYASEKEKILDEMQKRTWDLVPDPNNRANRSEGALEKAIG